ncbi:unnamed protein product [Rangifer tarandus platyrhynchus]|uniref:Uncharacterized protein n=1 Tax=Rangifer tarandus platyrhynchus TaxID=3082113 RepID=A0ABN8XI59_RANTA|nr:unnamed protein product [Rangifer tarandus platyrhynchus]
MRFDVNVGRMEPECLWQDATKLRRFPAPWEHSEAVQHNSEAFVVLNRVDTRCVDSAGSRRRTCGELCGFNGASRTVSAGIQFRTFQRDLEGDHICWWALLCKRPSKLEREKECPNTWAALLPSKLVRERKSGCLGSPAAPRETRWREIIDEQSFAVNILGNARRRIALTDRQEADSAWQRSLHAAIVPCEAAELHAREDTGHAGYAGNCLGCAKGRARRSSITHVPVYPPEGVWCMHGGMRSPGKAAYSFGHNRRVQFSTL